MKLKSNKSGDKIKSTLRTKISLNTTSVLINKHISKTPTHKDTINKLNQFLLPIVFPMCTNQKIQNKMSRSYRTN